MPPQLFGIEHILYIVITTVLAVIGLLLAKKYAKSERAQSFVLKGLALALQTDCHRFSDTILSDGTVLFPTAFAV